jgi:hypothetical protein
VASAQSPRNRAWTRPRAHDAARLDQASGLFAIAHLTSATARTPSHADRTIYSGHWSTVPRRGLACKIHRLADNACEDSTRSDETFPGPPLRGLCFSKTAVSIRDPRMPRMRWVG